MFVNVSEREEEIRRYERKDSPFGRLRASNVRMREGGKEGEEMNHEKRERRRELWRS